MQYQGDSSDGNSVAHQGEPDKPRSILLHPAVLAAYALALFALGFLAYLASEQSDTSSGAVGPPVESPGPDAGESTTRSPGQGEEAAAADSAVETSGVDGAAPEGAFVRADLDLDADLGPGLFTLSGRVPNEEIAMALLQSAELSYAPFVASDLEIDESLGQEPWMATAPSLIGLLPSVTDGEMFITSDGVQLSGRSPDPAYVEQFVGAVAFLSDGMPVTAEDFEISDLKPPRLVAAVDRGTITLSGEVPSPRIKEIIAGGAIGTYGADNVVDELTIDESTYTSFWMLTFPGVLQLLSPFPNYEIRVIDGVTSGAIQGGVNFEVDSTRIGEQAGQALMLGVAVLSRDRSLSATIVGHTDASGPEDYNQELSLARAESVVDFLVEAGIDRERLFAVGAGESEPLAPNESDEGKSLNRRVEFRFGPPDAAEE